MKSLNHKISGSAPSSGGGTQVGANFQAYLLRERESYLKSVHEFEKETPLIQTLAKLRETGATGGVFSPEGPGLRSMNPGGMASS